MTTTDLEQLHMLGLSQDLLSAAYCFWKRGKHSIQREPLVSIGEPQGPVVMSKLRIPQS